MYNTQCICTYNSSAIFLDSDNIDKDEKEFIRDAIYRQEFLDIFDIDEYDEKEVNDAIHALYKLIQHHSELKSCMITLAHHYFSNDEEMGLMMLFSFDYMYLSHLCISEYLETGNISETNMENLKKKLG